MKRIYLGLITIMGSGLVLAQNYPTMSVAKNKTVVEATASDVTNKAEGDIIWQNDFSNATDWTKVAVVGMDNWVIGTSVPSGDFPIDPINSTTAANGYALFDSDKMCSGNQNAYIYNTTPIDLSGYANANITFESYYRKFQGQCFIGFSTDATNWAWVEVHTALVVNESSANPTIVSIPTVGIGGSSTAYVAFKYVGGCDYAWMVDDVKLVEPFDNDVEISKLFQATEIGTTEGLDYFYIPASQASFPGLTFGFYASNVGGQSQTVTIDATGPSYTESSNSKVIAPGAMDSLSIAEPFMIPTAVGAYTVNFVASLSGGANNYTGINKYEINRTQFVYGRDNGTAKSAISNFSSNGGKEFKIGNVMEIFDDMTITGVQVALANNQPNAVGQLFDASIEILNSTGDDFEYLVDSDVHTIATEDLGAFVTLPLDGGPVTIPAGSVVLVMAHHFGDGGTGNDDVAFLGAQSTTEQTVLGYDAGGTRYYLGSPSALMVRLTEEVTNGLNSNELTGVSVYPNPTSGIITVTNDANARNTIVITDVTGKNILTTASTTNEVIDLSSFGAGIYFVNVSNENGRIVKKIIVD